MTQEIPERGDVELGEVELGQVDPDEVEAGAVDALMDDAPTVALARARQLTLQQGGVRRDAAMVQRAKEKARARKARKARWDDPEAGGRDPVGCGAVFVDCVGYEFAVDAA